MTNYTTNKNIGKERDITAIEQLIALAEKHQNDIESFIPLHTEEVIIVNIAGRRVIGKESFSRAMKQALESSLAKVFTKIEIQDIQFINPDIAIVSCIKNVLDERGRSADNPNTKLPSAGSLTYIVVRSDGQWKITLAQTTPMMK